MRQRGVDAAGGKAMIFNTITISDGISMGTEGMKYSLVSREVIADSIETVVGCEGFDGLVAIGGCDKNMPGCLIAMARLNRPGGVRLRRHDPARLPRGARTLDIVSVFEAVGAHANGKIDDDELHAIESKRHPRPGLLRRHVHRQHHGLRHRGAGHEPAQQLRPGRHFRGQEAGLRARRRAGAASCSSWASARATS